MSMPAISLDRLGTFSRMPDTITGSDWGGDQSDVYVAYATDVPIRYEITKVDSFTLWISDEDVSPEAGDRVTIGTLTLDIIRVQPWTRINGAFHHTEMTAHEPGIDRSLTDG